MKRTAHRAIAGAAFAALIVSTGIPATATAKDRPPTTEPPTTGDGHVSAQLHPGAPAAHPRARTSGAAGKADAAGKYLPYAPYRFFDTRGSGALGPRGTSTLTFKPSDIPSNATAVVFNLSAIKPSSDTYVTAWPSGTSRPGTASINPSAGTTSNNQVVVPLGSAKEHGKSVPAISFYNNAGKVHLVGDLEGFYATDTKGSSGYAPTGPKRVADTRSGSGIGAGKETTLDLSDTVPEGATAATLNLTGMAHGRATYLTAYPDGGDRPEASALNLGAKATATNQVTVSLPESKKLRVYNNAGSTDLVADLAGYYGGKGATATYQPVTPSRIVDTRSSGGPLGAGKSREFAASKVPGGAVAATMNLSGIRPSANTYLTAYAAGKKRPTASSLNLTRGQTASNAANVPLKDEHFAVYNGHGSTDLAADLDGYFVTHGD